MKKLFILAFIIFGHYQIFAQFKQFEGMQQGSGSYGVTGQGASVSISADGQIALIGGNINNLSRGATWVFSFMGDNFYQYGSKLVGSGASDPAEQGSSVSISADGKTALIGGPKDDTEIGTVWIYTFNGVDFVQAGNKLVGTGAIGTSQQGFSVSLSADGKTAAVGGPGDNSRMGAIWIYTFNGSSFQQFGSKIVTTDVIGTTPGIGWAVSLSGDGKTILFGGIGDNSLAGASWIYTFNGTNYVQLGSKLTSSIPNSSEGAAVAISANGKTALTRSLGGGNTLIYTFNGSNFVPASTTTISGTQSGIIGNGISITADGNRIISGDPSGNSYTGTSQIYDFNGTNFVKSDSITGADSQTGSSGQGNSVSISADGKYVIVGKYSEGSFWFFVDTVRVCSYVKLNPDYSAHISKDTLYLNASGSLTISSYQWKISDNIVGSASSLKYVLSAQQINLDSLHIKLIVSNMYGCADSISRTKSISQILDIKAAQNEREILKIDPNPFSSHLYIQTAIPGIFTIYNSMGQIIYKKSISGNENIELGALPQGAYYYQFVTDRFMKTGKLLKE